MKNFEQPKLTCEESGLASRSARGRKAIHCQKTPRPQRSVTKPCWIARLQGQLQDARNALILFQIAYVNAAAEIQKFRPETNRRGGQGKGCEGFVFIPAPTESLSRHDCTSGGCGVREIREDTE